MPESIIAVIPARGGSKRLPRKNVLPFLGKPMIVHTIEAAFETGLFARIVVSSDDEDILDIASEAGAELEMRDPELATDNATVSQVCRNFLNKEQRKGHHHDILCVLYATAPLRTSEDIKAVVSLVSTGKTETALATNAYSQPPNQALKIMDEQLLAPMWPDVVDLNSKDMPPLCVDNGSTYAVRVEQFLKTGSFIGPDTRGHLMPAWRSVDIDTQEDLELAKFYAAKIDT